MVNNVEKQAEKDNEKKKNKMKVYDNEEEDNKEVRNKVKL